MFREKYQTKKIIKISRNRSHIYDEIINNRHLIVEFKLKTNRQDEFRDSRVSANRLIRFETNCFHSLRIKINTPICRSLNILSDDKWYRVANIFISYRLLNSIVVKFSDSWIIRDKDADNRSKFHLVDDMISHNGCDK